MPIPEEELEPGFSSRNALSFPVEPGIMPRVLGLIQNSSLFLCFELFT